VSVLPPQPLDELTDDDDFRVFPLLDAGEGEHYRQF